MVGSLLTGRFIPMDILYPDDSYLDVSYPDSEVSYPLLVSLVSPWLHSSIALESPEKIPCLFGILKDSIGKFIT